jgi:hypothetical protein
MVQKVSVLSAGDVTIDVEYEDLTNAITTVIVNNPSGRNVTFNLATLLSGIIPLDTTLGVNRRVLVAGAVWKSVTNLGGATALCWPDGWGFDSLIRDS